MKSHFLALLIVLAAWLPAQQTLTTDLYATTGAGNNALVRDALGNLYSLVVTEDAAANRVLVLHFSNDGGTTWSDTGFTFNDATSGLTSDPSQRTTQCAMTIDDSGTLHAIWGAYVSGYNRQYYRSYDPNTTLASAIVSISAVTGASTATRTSAMDILVDSSNVVWIAAHGTTNWTARLVHSDFPYAAGGTFTDVGAMSMSASAQNSRLAVDSNGNIHCTYYRNLAPGQHWHRVYTPGTGWAPSTDIGNGTTAPHDYLSALSSDHLGNVHAIVAIDSGTPASTWKFRYKMWDAVNGWGPEVVLFDATVAEYTGVANYRIFDIACDAATGRVYAVYRDLANGGMFRLATKSLTDVGFTVLQDLTPPTLGQHEYYLPSIPDTLYPTFNNVSTSLDVTYQYRIQPGIPPYSWVHDRVSLSSGGPTLTLSAAPVVGTSITADMLSSADAGNAYICGFSLGNTPGIPLPDTRVIPLNVDTFLTFSLMPGNGFFTNTQGVLDGSGAGSAGIAIPNVPGIAGFTFYAGAVALAPAAPSGISTVFPGLTITLQ